jgi:hypothetical protein
MKLLSIGSIYKPIENSPEKWAETFVMKNRHFDLSLVFND